MKKTKLRLMILAMLSYLGPLCFVPLMNRDSEFVHAHAKQGLVLWAISNLLFVMVFIPFIGFQLIKVFIFILIIFSMMGIMAVLMHKIVDLPVIGYLAKLI